MATVRKRRSKDRKGKPKLAYQVRWMDPAGHRKARTFGIRAQAEAFANTVEMQKIKGEYRDPNLGKKERLGTFYENRWLAFAEQRLSPSTLKLMKDHWRLYVKPAFAKRTLASLTKLDIQTFVESVLREASPYQAESALRLLRSILNAAVDDGLLGRSIALDVKAPRRPNRKVRFLSSEQVAKLVAATPERWRAMILVAAYGGLRFGELNGLRLHCVDFLRRKILVEEAIIDVAGELHIRPPKSGRSRTVSMPVFVMDVLAEHIERWPPGRNGLVFGDEAGEPLPRSGFYKNVWWPSLKRAGIGHLRFHDLRHTSAALAIAAGAHPKTIQMRLGHHSAAFTLDVYGGLFEGLDEDLADRFDETATPPSDVEYEPQQSPMADVIDIRARTPKRGAGDGRTQR